MNMYIRPSTPASARRVHAIPVDAQGALPTETIVESGTSPRKSDLGKSEEARRRDRNLQENQGPTRHARLFACSLEKPPDLDPLFNDLARAKSAKELKEHLESRFL